MNGNIKKTVAVVVPVFNEEANIDAFCERIEKVASDLSEYRWQFVFVDDGSRDGTMEKLRQRQSMGQPITILRLSRNFGHQAAIKAGLDCSDADAVITMDGDLQHPPELIPRLVELWQEGFEVVQTVRRQECGTRRGLVRWAYRVINWFAERPIPPECADFRLIDRQVLVELKKMPEANPTLRGLVAWVGFRQTTIEYEVQNRLGGQSRFTFRQLVNLLAGGIFDLSRRPLAFGTAAGTILTIVGLVGWIVGLMSGIMFFIFVLAAIELWTLSLIGAYLGRAYNEVLGRPMYIVSEKVNFKEISQSYTDCT
ncbi:MAG: glycosyltransferase family 2 protein [Phycisphaerae bacterium]